MSFLIPHRLPSGEPAWLDLEVKEFTDRLTEFNPSLGLFKAKDGCWIIARVDEQGEPHIIMKSKPGAKLGPHVIEKLAQGDTRRRDNNPVEDMIRHNERLQREREEQANEAIMEAFDKVLSKAWRGRMPLTDEGIERAL